MMSNGVPSAQVDVPEPYMLARSALFNPFGRECDVMNTNGVRNRRGLGEAFGYLFRFERPSQNGDIEHAVADGANTAGAAQVRDHDKSGFEALGASRTELLEQHQTGARPPYLEFVGESFGRTAREQQRYDQCFLHCVFRSIPHLEPRALAQAG